MVHYKILIVDDIVENIQTITRFLEQFHPEYRLFQATGGASALDLVRSVPVDLIISDWDMPGFSGIELVKALKEDTRTRHIPVIIVTGVMLSSEDLDVALSAGAFDFIRKPVDPVELSARTNSALACVSMHMIEIDQKNRELDEKALILVKNNEFNIELAKKLARLAEMAETNMEATAFIHKITGEIDQKINEDNWQHFEIAFQHVHPEFSRNLVKQYPHLTRGELKHCVLIKLGMNIKDMASILYQSPDGLKVTRSRLRKKLQIANDISFNTFLSAF